MARVTALSVLNLILISGAPRYSADNSPDVILHPSPRDRKTKSQQLPPTLGKANETMKRRTKILLGMLAGVWITAMIVLSPMFVRLHRETKIARQTFKSFSDSLIRQDFFEAYKFCGADFQAAVPYEQFVNIQKDFQKDGGNLRSVKETGYEVTGEGTPVHWTAVIGADFIYPSGTKRFQVELHLENDRWVVFGYRQR